MSVKVVTDTSCDLPVGVEQEFDITVVPLIFLFGDEQFKDKTMSMAEFWEKAQTIWPKSAAPSAGDFERAFRAAIDAGHQVICITVTSKLSATYNAAHIASQHFSPDQVAVVDSATLAISQGSLALAAARAARAGQSLAEVVQTVEARRDKQHLYITLDTVQYLVKGGRASKLSGILAGLLKIRPLLSMQMANWPLSKNHVGGRSQNNVSWKSRRNTSPPRGCPLLTSPVSTRPVNWPQTWLPKPVSRWNRSLSSKWGWLSPRTADLERSVSASSQRRALWIFDFGLTTKDYRL